MIVKSVLSQLTMRTGNYFRENGFEGYIEGSRRLNLRRGKNLADLKDHKFWLMQMIIEETDF